VSRASRPRFPTTQSVPRPPRKPCRGRLARVFQPHSPSHARPPNRVAGVPPAFSNDTARPDPDCRMSFSPCCLSHARPTTRIPPRPNRLPAPIYPPSIQFPEKSHPNTSPPPPFRAQPRNLFEKPPRTGHNTKYHERATRHEPVFSALSIRYSTTHITGSGNAAAFSPYCGCVRWAFHLAQPVAG